MEFLKLEKNTRRQILRSSRSGMYSGMYVVAKSSNNNFLYDYLIMWLGIFDSNLHQKCGELRFKKTIFFKKHPRCKYALLVGFTREWAKGIEK